MTTADVPYKQRRIRLALTQDELMRDRKGEVMHIVRQAIVHHITLAETLSRIKKDVYDTKTYKRIRIRRRGQLVLYVEACLDIIHHMFTRDQRWLDGGPVEKVPEGRWADVTITRVWLDAPDKQWQ